MSINSYTENNQTFFTVRISHRSATNPTIRPTKQKSGIASLKEAQKIEKQLADEVYREVIRREQAGISWAALVDGWYEAASKGELENPISKKVLEDYQALVRYRTDAWMKKPAKEIKRHHCVELFSALGKEGLSMNRVKNAKNALSSIFKFGMDKGWFPEWNFPPTQGIKIKKDDFEKVREILSMNDVRRLLALAKEKCHPWYPVWVTALSTGMRSGELHALRWSDISLDELIITVARTYQFRFKFDKCTKGKDWRKIPINDELKALLLDLKKTQVGEHVLPRLVAWDRGEAARVLRIFCAENGLSSIRFHTLRACFATMMLGLGVDTARIMAIGGWKNLKTMEEYIRLAGIDVKGATDILNLLPPPNSGNVVRLFERNRC